MNEREIVYYFLSGAAAIASASVALFFLRFRMKTGDRLFTFLLTAFAILAVERVFVLVDLRDEIGSYVYLIRLAAFTLILVGVADKNRVGQTRFRRVHDAGPS